MIGVRRSWVDAWLGPLLKGTGVALTTAPVYYDGQVVVEHDARVPYQGAPLVLRLRQLARANARCARTAKIPSRDSGTRTSFWMLQARTDTHVSEGARWINTLAVGMNHRKMDFGDNFIDITEHPISYRSDFRARLSPGVTAIVGIDGRIAPFDVSAKAPPLPADGQDTGPYFARRTNLASASGSINRPGAYAMLELSPFAGVKLCPAFAPTTRTTSKNSWRAHASRPASTCTRRIPARR